MKGSMMTVKSDRSAARWKVWLMVCVTAGLVGLSGCGASPKGEDQQADSAEVIPCDVGEAGEKKPDAEAEVGGQQVSKEYVVLQEREDRLIVELPNRMVVVAQSLPTAPVVTAQAWIKTGSIFEQEHVGAGLSHFLEHLLAGGSTSTRDEQDSNAVLGRIGASTNAATGLDTVRYYVNTVSEHQDEAIELVSDWMQNAVVTEVEYARERTVIQREMEMRNSRPDVMLWKLTQQARYQVHPSRDPIIGYLDEFMTITRDEIYDFYKRMYVPNNMVFVVVGDIDKQAVVDKVAGLWSDVEPGTLPEVSLPVEPAIEQPREMVGHADIEIPKLRLAWPATRLGAEGDYELDVLAMVLGHGESSRLKRTVRDEMQLATSVGSYNASSVWTEGYFTVTAEPTDREASLDELKGALLAQVAALRDGAVSQAELDRAKRKVLADIAQNNQTVEGVASTLAWEVISLAEPGYLERYAEAVQSITAEDLQATAKQFLTDDRLITVQLLPVQEGVNSAFTQTKRQAPPIDPATVAHEPVELDNAAMIRRLSENLSSAEDGSAGIEVDPPVTRKLDNGLTVVVQRSTVVPAVAMQLYWPGGLLADEPGGQGVANATARMLTRGTTTRSADEIAEAVEDLGATLYATAANNTAYTSATALRDDWQTVLALVGEVTLEPAFDTAEWNKLKPRLLAMIDRENETWIGELRQAFRKEYFGDHPWSSLTVGHREVVQTLTAEDLRGFHETHLHAPQMVLSVVGDVDPEAVFAEAQRLLGDVPDKAKVFEPASPTLPEAKIVQVMTVKPATAFYIGFGPGVSREDPDYPALMVLTKVMSDFPAGWLEQELRGRGPGLVYSVGASMWAGMVRGNVAVIFNTGTEQANEALTRTMSVIRRAKAGDFDPADIERAKAKVLTQEFFGKQSLYDRTLMNALDVIYGLDDPGSKRFLKAVSEVDAEALKQMANKRLNNPVVVVLTNTELDNAQLEAAVAGEGGEAE